MSSSKFSRQLQLKETLIFNAPKYTDQDIALLKLTEDNEKLQSINLAQANTVVKIQVKENSFQKTEQNSAEQVSQKQVTT